MGFNIWDNDGCSWINGKIQNNFQVDTKIRLSLTHRINNIFYYDYFTGGRSPDGDNKQCRKQKTRTAGARNQLDKKYRYNGKMQRKGKNGGCP